eukprot:CAMPEP_0117672562 /NCGR_PEP_ID=MMETSP0804-20121206/13973_1 /TAXON_ID=1074897 /ORGANISM="Tetraselmis astigmatica, Strain CCMP880" /LENGTH=377 /DNA_ID=CAMNT_0005481177 /DNA_START=61 /DNA_END=1194 /DNA_ORIENTATION=-
MAAEPGLALEKLLGPDRPRPTKKWQTRYVKMMLVGDSGLGKTTLLRTLLSGPGDKLELHDGSETSHREFMRRPDSLCSTLIWEDDVDKIRWVYRVQDTPGYGDDLNIMNNIKKMKAFVNRCNEKWLKMEQDIKRGVDMSLMDDPRIDLCLFCISPHRVRNIDLYYMYELGQVVPIVPIVTKADTMTIREAEVHRRNVASRLEHPGLPGMKGPINTFQFDEETLERAGVSLNNGVYHMPPFLVIASNTVNKEKHKSDPPIYWPQREYMWGTSEAFNPEHSDLINLRALLFKEACEEISATKRQRFEKWRVQYLTARTNKLRKFLVKVATIGAAAVGSVLLYKSELAEPVRKVVNEQLEKLPKLPFPEKKPEPVKKRGW